MTQTLHKQVSEWLSDVILGDPEAGMRLLYHPTGDTTRLIKYIRMLSVFTQSISRISRPDKKLESVVAPTRREKDKPFFAHMFPYMMMTQPSITELNR